MGMIKTKGIVVAVTTLGEHDKLLTVFTDTLGAISVSAKGATSKHNNLKAMTRMFCCGEFVLYDKKNGYYTISEVSPITDFMGLSKDLDRLTAATEIVRFVKYTAVENEESGDVLRLLLNSLYLLANTEKNINLIKCVYYLKALEYMGLPPVTEECAVCGEREGLSFFAPEEGGMVCDECAQNANLKKRLTDSALRLMDYILKSPLKAAFGIDGDKQLFTEVLEAVDMFLKVHLSYNL